MAGDDGNLSDVRLGPPLCEQHLAPLGVAVGHLPVVGAACSGVAGDFPGGKVAVVHAPTGDRYQSRPWSRCQSWESQLAYRNEIYLLSTVYDVQLPK